MDKRIINGCCLLCDDSVELMRRMISKGVQVDMIFTDPPYHITRSGCSGNFGGMFKKNTFRTGRIFKHNDCPIEAWAPLVFKMLKDNCHAYIMCNMSNLCKYLQVLTSVGFKFVKLIIWDKVNKIAGSYYMDQCELIIFLRKGKARIINFPGTSNIWSVINRKAKLPDGSNVHDTEKPVELYKRAIINSTAPGEIVFDPFMGIAPGAEAAILTGRRFVGIDIDVDFFKFSIGRIANVKKE